MPNAPTREASTSFLAIKKSIAASQATTDSGAQGNSFSPVPGASITNAAIPFSSAKSAAQPLSSLKTSAPHIIKTAGTGASLFGVLK